MTPVSYYFKVIVERIYGLTAYSHTHDDRIFIAFIEENQIILNV
jgi:hypothetical protein